jgi:hypothetical protein
MLPVPLCVSQYPSLSVCGFVLKSHFADRAGNQRVLMEALKTAIKFSQNKNAYAYDAPSKKFLLQTNKQTNSMV